MKFKFEKLLVWQKAMNLGEEIKAISYKFPKEETFNLAQQVRRAADSVALNISDNCAELQDRFERWMAAIK